MTADLLFRMIISVNQLSVCGPISDWCEELAQQISDHSFYSSVRPVANMNDESQSHISPNVMSILTNPHSTNVPVQTKDSKILQRTFEWVKLGMMLVLWERFLLDNISWQSMTWIWLDLNMLDHAENRRQDGFKESRKLVQYWKSRLRTTFVNMELKSKLIPWRIMDHNPGLWSAGEWTNTSTNFLKRMGNLFTEKKCSPVRSDRFRQNKRKNQLHHYLHSQRWLYRSIKGGGKTFLPSTSSTKDPCHSVSQRQWPEYNDIEVFIEKQMEQWIGIYCYLCHVAITGTPWDGRMMSG